MTERTGRVRTVRLTESAVYKITVFALAFGIWALIGAILSTMILAIFFVP